MKVNWKRAKRERDLETLNRQESDALTYGLALGCEFCRNLRGFGRGRLNDLVRGMYLELKENFEQYRDSEDQEFSREEVPFLYTGLRNQIMALVDVESIEERFAVDRNYGDRSGLRDAKRDARYQLLCDRERMYRSFWYAMMIWLWRTYGWGEDRLARFYSFVRQTYKSVFQEYLIGTAAKDSWLNKTMTETIKKFTDLGVVF